MTIQISVKCISHMPKWNNFFLSVYLWQLPSWSYLVLKTFGKTGGLSLILLWRFYLSIWFSDTATWKSQKPLLTKNACKMKNIWFACKKSIFTLFQLLLWCSFAFLKTAFWCHFSENGPVWVNICIFHCHMSF